MVFSGQAMGMLRRASEPRESAGVMLRSLDLVELGSPSSPFSVFGSVMASAPPASHRKSYKFSSDSRCRRPRPGRGEQSAGIRGSARTATRRQPTARYRL